MVVCNKKAVKALYARKTLPEASMIETQELREALLRAFTVAIQKVGLATFKATSLFASNNRKAELEKKAV